MRRTASSTRRVGLRATACSAENSTSPPGYMVWWMYFLSAPFLPVSRTLSALITTTKSPQSACGVKVGLFLPRRTLAMVVAMRPSTLSFTSMTTQLRWTVFLLPLPVFREMLRAQKGGRIYWIWLDVSTDGGGEQGHAAQLRRHLFGQLRHQAGAQPLPRLAGLAQHRGRRAQIEEVGRVGEERQLEALDGHLRERRALEEPAELLRVGEREGSGSGPRLRSGQVAPQDAQRQLDPVGVGGRTPDHRREAPAPAQRPAHG